jgi:hypothetical protein
MEILGQLSCLPAFGFTSHHQEHDVMLTASLDQPDYKRPSRPEEAMEYLQKCLKMVINGEKEAKL